MSRVNCQPDRSTALHALPNTLVVSYERWLHARQSRIVLLTSKRNSSSAAGLDSVGLRLPADRIFLGDRTADPLGLPHPPARADPVGTDVSRVRHLAVVLARHADAARGIGALPMLPGRYFVPSALNWDR
jgi:hypothetical protein